MKRESKQKKTGPAPNMGLFIRLQPNVKQMAEATGLSRTTVYSLVDGTRTPTAGTVRIFNDYLKELFEQRMKAAKQIS